MFSSTSYATSSSDPIPLHVDSGATVHLIRDLSLFSELRPASKDIVVANGQIISANQVGTVKLVVNGINIALQDAVYAPEAPCNLLSVPQIASLGHKVILAGPTSSSIVLRDGRSLSLQAEHGDLFMLRCQRTPPQSSEMAYSVVAPTNSKNASPIVIHRRLGHLNAKDMVRMGVIERVSDIPFCDDCALAKSKRAAVSKASKPRHKEKLQLIHTDINGPMEVPSLSGKRFVIAFTDDATRYVRVYFMTRKNEAHLHFKQYLHDMQALSIELQAGSVCEE